VHPDHLATQIHRIPMDLTGGWPNNLEAIGHRRRYDLSPEVKGHLAVITSEDASISFRESHLTWRPENEGLINAMRSPSTVRGAEEFGRVRLSRSFFMRDFLYSDIANVCAMRNLPNDPDLAVSAGRALCTHLLEPLQEVFGRIAIRSAYRSPEINAYGNKHFKSCGSNERNRGRHIWDERAQDGCMGAMATIVVPWLVDRMNDGTQWTSMAWWIHDHLEYSELQFFPKLAAFNIGWRERPLKRITSFIRPCGLLTKPGMANFVGTHSAEYIGFPTKSSVGEHRA
jgi:hypothetical protein